MRLRFLVGLSVLAIAGSSIAGVGAGPLPGQPAGTTATDLESPSALAASPGFVDTDAGMVPAATADPTDATTATTPATTATTAPLRPAIAGTVAPPSTAAGQLDAAPAPTAGTAAPAAALSLAPLGMFITNAEPLPPCAYGDVPVQLSSTRDWALTMLDTTYALTTAYVPPGLVPASDAGIRSREPLRSIVIPDLRRMAQAASAAGAAFSIASGYRSFHNQSVTFRHWENVQGRAKALISSARPGHSEHQLGTAMDFKSRDGSDPWNYKDWAAQTAAGQWLSVNAWKYGFIMSYPRGQTARTCYEYEPWHYRYVGVAEAAAVHSSGLVLRQWLWEHQPNPEVPSP